VLIVTFLIFPPYYNNLFIYDYINKEIRLGSKTKKVKKYLPGVDKYKFEYNCWNREYTFKRKKSSPILIKTNIIYPTYYTDTLVELYNLSNNRVSTSSEIE